MRKIWTLLLMGSLLLKIDPVYAEVAEQPGIYGQYAIAMDATTGEVYYGKNETEKAHPASLTKVMTALLLDEKMKDGEFATASEHAVGQEASQAYFKLEIGEKISKKDALNAMMVISANDVSMAVAEKIGQTQEGFASMMTARAKELGATQTNFTTPNGLTDPNHYTTAYDVALITKEAITHPNVLKAMGTKEIEVKTSIKNMKVTNPSKIHDNPLVIGGKTGYTNAASNCLIEVFEKDGKRIITVVMKSSLSAEYTDLQTIADFAFSKTHVESVVKKGEQLGVNIIGGENVPVTASEDVIITLPTGVQAASAIRKKVTMNPLNHIKTGEQAGKIELLYKGKTIKEVPLLAELTVIEKVEKMAIGSGSTSYWKIFLLAIGVPIPIYISYLVYYNRKKRKKLWGLEDEGVS